MDSASISKADDSLGRVISDREPEYWRDREGAEEVIFSLVVYSLAGVKAAEMGTGRPTVRHAGDRSVIITVMVRGSVTALLHGCCTKPSTRKLEASLFLPFVGLLKWAMLGSNQRPLPCEGSALPLS
jgi:hypothetical protein